MTSRRKTEVASTQEARPSDRPTDDPIGGRRLTARSVLASTLLGVTPPELPTRALVATAELLGVTAGTARVALSRMVAAGEVEATGTGYRLVGPLLARQARQDLSRAGAPGPWDGSWRTAVVVGDARRASARVDLRAAMAALRLGELREGVWLRPANLPEATLPAAEATVAAQTLRLDARPRPDEVERLVADLWDLPGWSRRADRLRTRLADLAEGLDEGRSEVLAPAFVASADVLRHLQADPLLPAELLPTGWAGDRLRGEHAAFDRRFKAVLADHQRSLP